MNESSQLLLLEEVAREARVSLSTVRFWIGAGKLRSVRPGRRRLVRRSDFEAFLTGSASKGERTTPRTLSAPQEDTRQLTLPVTVARRGPRSTTD